MHAEREVRIRAGKREDIEVEHGVALHSKAAVYAATMALRQSGGGSLLAWSALHKYVFALSH